MLHPSIHPADFVISSIRSSPHQRNDEVYISGRPATHVVDVLYVPHGLRSYAEGGEGKHQVACDVG